MDSAQSLVFVNVHGLKVSDSTVMRRKLRADKVGFFVAKKTLTSIALTNKKYKGTAPALIGEFGLAYGADLVAPARGVYEFEKKHKENRLFHIKDQNLEGINRSSFWKKVMATSNKKYKEIPQLTDLSIQQMLDNQDVEDFAIQYFIGENGDTIEINNKN